MLIADALSPKLRSKNQCWPFMTMIEPANDFDRTFLVFTPLGELGTREFALLTMCLGTFIDHVSPVLRARPQKLFPIRFLFPTTWAPHGRYQSNRRHAASTDHFPKRAQIFERGAGHSYMTDRMEVDQACKSDLFLLIRDPEPVC